MSNNAQKTVIMHGSKLSKVYEDATATLEVLSSATIDVYKGEVLAITGKSGAGKSTLLHLLGLIDSPSSGEVILEGENIATATAERRSCVRNERFGFVFQAYHLVPELTAIENVMLPAMMGSISGWFKSRAKVKKRAAELLESVGLSERFTHRPSALSGGEQQRVAIARALINEPDLLFCDEPTGNLDENTSESVNALLHKLNNEMGVTQVIVTHDSELAEQATRVANIEHGRVVI